MDGEGDAEFGCGVGCGSYGMAVNEADGEQGIEDKGVQPRRLIMLMLTIC
jgi:hypothetical protein